MAAHLNCIHGLIWSTCALCYEKDEQAVVDELNRQREEQSSRLIYDYQEVGTQAMDGDADLAYDLDDSGM